MTSETKLVSGFLYYVNVDVDDVTFWKRQGFKFKFIIS